jgi:type I restriction enzyme S subunit
MSINKKLKISSFIEINPREILNKGVLAKKVGMDKLQPFCRDIVEYEIVKYSGGVKFRNGDTIMARITPCLENGKTAMINILDENEVGFGSTEYIVFRAKDEVTDPYYVFYLVCSPIVRDVAIKSMVGSSGRQRVQIDVIENIETIFPNIETQKKISSILKLLDDKININNKINNNLPPHLCVAQIAATQRRQIPKTDGCLHTDGEVSVRGGNLKEPQVFSSRRVA